MNKLTKTALLLAVAWSGLLVAGCVDWTIDAAELERNKDVCNKNGGVRTWEVQEIDRGPDVVTGARCHDGAHFDIERRLSN